MNALTILICFPIVAIIVFAAAVVMGSCRICGSRDICRCEEKEKV